MTKRNGVQLFGLFAVLWTIRVILAFVYGEYADSPLHFVALIVTACLSIAVFIKNLIRYRFDSDEEETQSPNRKQQSRGRFSD